MKTGLQLVCHLSFVNVNKYDNLKLKVVVLHDGIGKEVHMTQPIRFAAEDLVTVACARWSSFG